MVGPPTLSLFLSLPPLYFSLCFSSHRLFYRVGNEAAARSVPGDGLGSKRSYGGRQGYVSPPIGGREQETALTGARRELGGVDLAVWPSPSSCRYCGPWWRGMATTTRLSCRRHHHLPFLPRPLPPPSFFSSLGCRRRHPVELTRSSLGFTGSSKLHHLGDDAAGRGGGLAGDRRRFARDVGASHGATASPNAPLHPRCKL